MGAYERKPWSEFVDAKLFWWVNRSLHLFGWTLVREIDKDSGEITEVYPARTSVRGFSRETEEAGFTALTHHLRDTIPDLVADVDA